MRNPYGREVTAQCSSQDIRKVKIPKLLTTRNPPCGPRFDTNPNFIHRFIYIFLNSPIPLKPY